MQFFGMTKFYYTTPEYVIPFLFARNLSLAAGAVASVTRYATEDTGVTPVFFDPKNNRGCLTLKLNSLFQYI